MHSAFNFKLFRNCDTGVTLRDKGIRLEAGFLVPAWLPIRCQLDALVRFSNRPFGVKHFQTIHLCSVDVAHGLVLLFGIGTKALPSWDSVLNAMERVGPYVVPGDDPEQPRHDLKRPWDAVTKHAGLTGVRVHDLRHTYASFGAGGGLGLPIIGRLLGHTHAATTARYAHLDNDPLRRASESIAGRIAAALEGKQATSMVPLRRRATR